MSAQIALLTPPGMGAIATIAVVGPNAWKVIRGLIRLANDRVLPEKPLPGRIWLGNLGDGIGDEVVLAVKRVEPETWLELHCHGGPKVVNWLLDFLQSHGCERKSWGELLEFEGGLNSGFDSRALEPLSHAISLRTASILLDQYHGAFHRSIREILAAFDLGDTPTTLAKLSNLTRYRSVGHHLVQPWRVAVAGAPNVGKSSLINALAGYQRTIVAPVAGTTRDLVSVQVVLDGWPIELIDTAGIRDTYDALESTGVQRAKSMLAHVDLILWLVDSSAENHEWPPPEFNANPVVVVANKLDITQHSLIHNQEWDILPISAKTGDQLSTLIHEIVHRLIPCEPNPGDAVPFRAEMIDWIDCAERAMRIGDMISARNTLIRCLT